jgi:hypothetical protein
MKNLRILSVLGLLLLLAPIASAQVDQFTGKWKNVDANTGGLTTLEITLRRSGIDIQAWGKCHPSDCPWGHALGTVYTTRPDAVKAGSSEPAQVLSTIYVHSFAETILIIRPAENGQLQVELLEKYTDQSGRRNIRAVMTFARVADLGAAK